MCVRILALIGMADGRVIVVKLRWKLTFYIDARRNNIKVSEE